MTLYRGTYLTCCPEATGTSVMPAVLVHSNEQRMQWLAHQALRNEKGPCSS